MVAIDEVMEETEGVKEILQRQSQEERWVEMSCFIRLDVRLSRFGLEFN